MTTSPAPVPLSDADLAAIEARHYPVEWQRCGEDGVPDPAQPLPPFCAACTDSEWVSAVEFGDTIDEAADVVSWPCDAAQLRSALAAERQRADEAEARIADARRRYDKNGNWSAATGWEFG